MCTVSFSPEPGGYLLGMNRDEQRRRAPGFPPRKGRAGGVEILCPQESGGGTWVGVNGAGVCLALINWYSVPRRVADAPVSRGVIVRDGLSATSSHGLLLSVTGQPLSRINPFRLLGVFPAEGRVLEWRWNLGKLELLAHRWEPRAWISSGWDEAGAQERRGVRFRRALAEPAPGGVAWMRRFHTCHDPQPGPYSVCMHREDAVTVSYTEVEVGPERARLRYHAGAPCEAAEVVEDFLPRSPEPVRP
jgi:hypothetical protein